MADISTITSDGVTYNIKDPVARAGNNSLLTINVASFSVMPKTVNNANITANHVLVHIDFGTPSAIQSDITWTTSNGKIVLNGEMNGSTTARLVLGKSTF